MCSGTATINVLLQIDKSFYYYVSFISRIQYYNLVDYS